MREAAWLSNFAKAYYGWCLLRDGRLREAILQLETTMEVEPSDPRTRLFLGQTYVLDSRFEEGIAQIRTALAQSRDNSLVLSGLGWACGLAGRRQEALEIVEKLKKRFSREYPRPYLVAKVYAGLGERDLAFEKLEASFREHETSLAFVKNDESLASLSRDPRLADLLCRMNLEPQKVLHPGSGV